MWICPKCNAINYGRNSCECCDYGGIRTNYYKDGVGTTTNDPLPMFRTIVIC